MSMKTARRLLADARRIVALTGAGISAESGVPTFRGPEGLWRTHRPEDLSTPEAFARKLRSWRQLTPQRTPVRGPGCAGIGLGQEVK